MVTITRGTVEDVDNLLKLSMALFDEIGHRFPIADSSQAKAFYRNLLDSEDYVVFIASDAKDSACGMITLSEGVSVYAGGKFGIIREFYVIKQNRSAGIGKALLQKAVAFARNKGWKRLEVTPPHKDEWKRTYDFYMREGFVEIGPRLKLENL